MSTLQDTVNFVTQDYLNRSDITAVTQNAALKAFRLICSKVPFDELQALSAELPLVTGQDTYDLNTLVPPLLGIVDIRLNINNGQLFRRLRRSASRLYDSLGVITQGPPATYARSAARTIQINPPPDTGTYSMRLRYWTRPAEAAPITNTVLPWPMEWDELHNWETAWRVLNLLGQEDRAQLLVQQVFPPKAPTGGAPKRWLSQDVGIIPRLWNELLSTTSQKENVDEEFSINPLVRPYSIGNY